MTYITKDEILTAAQAVVKKCPNGQNVSRRYTDVDGNHCLAAQILIELGQPVPGFGENANGSCVRGGFFVEWAAVNLSRRLDLDAESALDALQSDADGGRGRVMKWKDVVGMYVHLHESEAA